MKRSKEILKMLMFLLGYIMMLVGFVEFYCIKNPQIYSRYIFTNLKGTVGISLVGIETVLLGLWISKGC